MFHYNPKSKRKNVFQEMFDSDRFKNVLSYRNDLTDFPFWVEIELTNYCNLKCLFCGQQAMTRPRGYMNETVFKKVIDECKKYNAYVQFCRWGEPFLHPAIIKYAEYVKSKDLLLLITNNGLVISEEDMYYIVTLGVDWVIFSFQGATKEKHMFMRNNGRYDELCDTVHRLVDIRGGAEKPYIRISNTITDESEDEVKDFVEQWGSVVDCIGIGRTNLSKCPAHNIKDKAVAEKLIYLRDAETIKHSYKPCKEIYTELSVDWDGKVSCCCGDFDNFLTVGDVNDDSLFNIWNNSEKLKHFRWMLDNDMHRSLTHCSTCWNIYDEL